MLEIIREITLDVSEENRFTAITAKQYDSRSRYLLVRLTDRGEALILPDTASVLISATRPDGLSDGFEGLVQDGAALVPLDYWMLMLDGIVTCELVVTGADGYRLTTMSFALDVRHSCFGDGLTPGGNHGVYVRLLEEIEDLKKKIGEGLGGSGTVTDEQIYAAVEKYLTEHPLESPEAEKAAESAKKSAEDAEAAASEAKTVADEAGESSRTADRSATSAAESASQAASSAESAESSASAAQTAKEGAETAMNEAAQQATNAGNAAQEAATAATGAAEAKTAAQTAQQAAEKAKSGAESARDEVNQFANNAAGSASAAATSATNASASAQAAQAAQTAAESAKSTAAQKATDATNAAQTATGKATEAAEANAAAQTAKGEAQTAATNAGKSATAAAGSATTASNAATAAQAAQAATESAKAEVEQKLANGDYKGKDGKTPEAGVDYPTVEQVDSYIAEELAKRDQFVPIPAASVEDMTDTTKIYYLPATGELWAYAPTQVTVGGYKDLADHTSEDWNESSRLNASAAIAAAVYDKTVSFVSNKIPVKPDSEVYIKNVTAPTRTEAAATQFAAVLYNESGDILNSGSQPMILREVSGSGFSVTAINQCWDAVTLMEDGSYKWKVGSNNAGDKTYSTVSYIRVAGIADPTYGDVIITVDEPMAEPTVETVYKWAGTGHFITSEESIAALESRVNELEDKTEELEVTVARLKTNSSISMQSGAVWYAFGDSITEGYISYLTEDGTASSKLEPASQHSWAYTVAKLNGYELTNYGVGGSGYAYGKSGVTTAREQVDAVDFTGCDLVTFAWGCNDWKYDLGPIGSKDDDKDTDTTTCAALKWCIERVLSQAPLCKILVITPINVKRGTFEGNYGLSYEMTNTGTLQDVYDAIVSVCESYGIEHIDMTHSSVVNRSNISALLLDTVHPTPEAYAAMGKELARKINFA